MIHDDTNFVTLHNPPAKLAGMAVHLVRGRESLGRMFSYTVGVFGPPLASTTGLDELIGQRLPVEIKTSEEGTEKDGTTPLPKTR